MALAHRKASFSCLRSCSQTRAGLSFPVHHQQVRHATLIRRPKRPYTFTQLVTLSDGSTYIQRSTSPIPIYKSSKDLKNTPLWNPSSQKLMNREEDEAGRLRLFRQRFGRGWDAETAETAEAKEASEGGDDMFSEDNLLDLISGYGQEPGSTVPLNETNLDSPKAAKGKGKSKK